MKHEVIINKEKCIGCGLCVKDCVSFDIELKDEKATSLKRGCISCGHCEAICPQGAIKLTGFEDTVEEFDKQTRLNPDELLQAIKTRRSIRVFKEDKIPSEVIDMILEAGRLAPTAANRQTIRYAVLEEKITECEKIATTKARKLINAGKKVIPMLSSLNFDEHFFFKKAPVAIVIFSNDKISASLAAENMAFMAEANGLGVLYSGFFTGYVNMSKKIRKIIGINKKSKAVTTLVIGYPDVEYKRTAHRESLNVIRA